jgi:hypothetical protein
VVKVVFLLTRWFRSFQFAGPQKCGYVPRLGLFAQAPTDTRRRREAKRS